MPTGKIFIAMSLSKTYNPREVEDKWYQYWLDKQFFRSVPDHREPFTVVIPPPNVTGVLHMGHMLNNTIQDVLIRRARMRGYNACWVPGTDHASIATEAKVVAMLKEKGINKQDISREEFLKYAWEWKEKYGGIILEQLKKLGASCDWERTRFTMDPDMSEAVIDTFIHLYNKGLVYRGVRMVNWDPQGKTAVSDEEVIYKEVTSKLYYVKYRVVSPSNSAKGGEQISDNNIEEGKVPSFGGDLGEAEWITIATTRPETILGDTAVCVHPDDERYKHLVGKKVLIPFVNREVPIIADTYIDLEFGTGALKVTPAHDINDYELGLKHNLQVIDTIDEDGKMSPAAQFYVGMDRFACRKQIAIDLEEKGFLVKVEEIKNKNGLSERTNAVIEPKLSVQWFVNMKELAKPALEVVESGEVKLIPEKFINTYRHWMENCKDWCISRQLWWGQRIPAWYNEEGQLVVAKTEAEAIEKFKSQNLKFNDIKQDADVVDTWFSSWLWPITVFDPSVCAAPNSQPNADLAYYYPTNDLVTAPEILFFWVARMIMAGKEFRGQIPFKNVYLTGIVRDKLGRKMSKSLGNSPDPIELIEKFGADGVRMGMLLAAPAGNDLPFDESYCEQGRNFANKIWNAFRLVKGWEVDATLSGKENEVAIQWFESRWNQVLGQLEEQFNQYRLSEALMSVYKLVWDDYCSWYLEMIKPVYGQPIDAQTYAATISFFEQILKLLHPFMPFITEELWHEMAERKDGDCIIVADYPEAKKANEQLLNHFEQVAEVIAQVRNIRNSKQLSPKEALPLAIKAKDTQAYVAFAGSIIKLANITELSYVDAALEGTSSFLVKQDEFFVDLGNNIDVDAERSRMEQELDYNRGFLKSVMAKLSNEKFVANAKPEIVAAEQKKKADAEGKIKLLEESLAKLG